MKLKITTRAKMTMDSMLGEDFFGEIGTPTGTKLKDGTELFIGDVAIVISKNSTLQSGISPIIKGIDGGFVLAGYGIKTSEFVDDKCKKTKDDLEPLVKLMAQDDFNMDVEIMSVISHKDLEPGMTFETLTIEEA